MVSFCEWLTDWEITPYMPTRDAVGRTRSLLYGQEFILLTGEQQLHLPCRPAAELRPGRNGEISTFGYIGTRKKCGPCEQRSQCDDRTVPVSCNPHERSSSAASARPPNYTGVRTGNRQRKKIARGALCRTKESQSHRPQSARLHRMEVSYESSSSWRPLPRTSSG